MFGIQTHRLLQTFYFFFLLGGILIAGRHIRPDIRIFRNDFLYLFIGFQRFGPGTVLIQQISLHPNMGIGGIQPDGGIYPLQSRFDISKARLAQRHFPENFRFLLLQLFPFLFRKDTVRRFLLQPFAILLQLRQKIGRQFIYFLISFLFFRR